MSNLPKSQELVEPLLTFLINHGRIASNAEIAVGVASLLGLSETALQHIHSGNRTEFEYRLAWARTQVKSAGRINSPSREHWQITPK